MLNFLRKKKNDILILSIWIILINYYHIVFQVVGIDTEQALMELDSNLNWTLGSGRFASALLRKMLMPLGFNYTIAVILTIIGWISICLTYQYCLEKQGIMNKWCGLIFSLIFVSCPLWAEQIYFTCSVFVNVYGILFAIISAYLIVKIFNDGFNWKYFLSAIVLGVLAIGIYQACLYLLAANCIVFLTLDFYSRDEAFKQYILQGLKCVFIIVLITILYFIISKVAIGLWYDPLMDYAGHKEAGSYISNRIQWGVADIRQCYEAIKSYIVSSYRADYVYGLPIYPVLFFMVQVYFMVKYIKIKNKKNIFILVGTWLLLICVYAGCIIYGNTISAREQMVLPLFVAFCVIILLNELLKYVDNNIHNKERIYPVIISLLLLCIVFYGNRLLKINKSDYIRYNADVDFASHIMEEIKIQIGDYSDKKIVFIGQNQWVLPNEFDRGEVIGYSIFSWDASGPVGVNYRSYGFLNSCGYEYEKPMIEEIQMVQNAVALGEVNFEDKLLEIWNEFVVVDMSQF